MKKLLWQLYFGLIVSGLLMFLLGAAILLGGCNPRKPAPGVNPPGYMPYSHETNPVAEIWEARWRAYDYQRDGRVARDGRKMAMDCESVEFLWQGYFYSRMNAWACWKLMYNQDRPDVLKLVEKGEIVILGPDFHIVAHYPNPEPAKEQKFLGWLRTQQEEKHARKANTSH